MHNEYIAHSGTLGMKWGRRLYQNKDGSLTPLGRLRYGSKDSRSAKPRTVETSTAIKNKKAKTNSESESSKEETEQDYYKRLKSKSVSDLSDAELNKLSNRLQTENIYRQRLTENTPPEKNARIKKVIADVSEKAVRSISDKAIEAIGQRVSKAILGDKDAGKDTITKIAKDLSKVSDSDLEKMVKRAQNESKLKAATDYTSKDKKSSDKKEEAKSGTVENGSNDSTNNAKGVEGQQWGKREPNIIDGEYRDVTENPGSNNGSMTQLLLEDKKRKRNE